MESLFPLILLLLLLLLLPPLCPLTLVNLGTSSARMLLLLLLFVPHFLLKLVLPSFLLKLPIFPMLIVAIAISGSFSRAWLKCGLRRLGQTISLLFVLLISHVLLCRDPVGRTMPPSMRCVHSFCLFFLSANIVYSSFPKRSRRRLTHHVWRVQTCTSSCKGSHCLTRYGSSFLVRLR